MRFIFPLLSFFLLVSCEQKTKSAVTETVIQQDSVKFQADTFVSRKIISSAPLQRDASQSFALYLPAQYNTSKKIPLLIFFDPHGDGTIPLHLYRHLADKYNYILLASNTSKNGMNTEQTNAIANNLIADAKARFNIDEKRISLCGFSGGAKVALLNACENENVATVIYCGAATELPPTARNFSLLGFAGKRDMNYTDEIVFDQSQNSSPRKHCLIEYNGKHEWADEKTFENAFLFLENKLNSEKCFELSAEAQRAIGAEQSNKQIYMQAFQAKDLNWWKQEIVSLNKKKKTDLMYERLLGFISLACYSYANNALQQNNLPMAEHILSIYTLADPGNKDCEAFTAELKRRK